MFERTGGYYLPLSLGAKVTFARGVAQVADDLASQAPTVIFAVPRIFDRFRARIDKSLAQSRAKRRLFDKCVERGFRVATGKGSRLDRALVPGLRKLVAKPVLARGRNVMLGYWKNPEATRAALTDDGWLRTGDLAEIKDGKVCLRGRAKDILLVLSNGEKLPPQDAEFAILHDPVFEQVMLAGEGRPYVVLLAVTQETDEKVLIRRANDQLKNFPRWTRVRRVVLQKEPWSVDNGLLTPTLKHKRPMLLEKLAPQIEAAYAEPSASG